MGRGALSRHVALIRGINVGGKNKLPMSELTALFAEAGCRGVRTYIASGNVVFDASPKVVASLPRMVTGRIESRFGLHVPVVIRRDDEIRQAAAGNPFLEADAGSLFVMFLADVPDRGRVADLDPERSPGDAYEVRGRDVFLRLSNGVADTKLTNAYFDSKLGTVSTGRNWRTVLKLIEMCDAPG